MFLVGNCGERIGLQNSDYITISKEKYKKIQLLVESKNNYIHELEEAVKINKKEALYYQNTLETLKKNFLQQKNLTEIWENHYKKILSSDTVTTLEATFLKLKATNITQQKKDIWLERYNLFKEGLTNFGDTDTKSLAKPILSLIEKVLIDSK